MRTLLLLLTLLIAWLPAGPAEAGPDAQPTARADRNDKVKKRLRRMRAIVLVEELELDEATAAKLMPILNRYDDQFAKIAREQQALRKQADDAAGRADDAA